MHIKICGILQKSILKQNIFLKFNQEANLKDKFKQPRPRFANEAKKSLVVIVVVDDLVGLEFDAF